MKFIYVLCALALAAVAWAGSPALPNSKMLPELNALVTTGMAAHSADELFFDLRRQLTNDTVRCGPHEGSQMPILVNDALDEDAVLLEFSGNFFAFRDPNGRLLRVLSYRQYSADPLSIVGALQAAYGRANR